MKKLIGSTLLILSGTIVISCASRPVKYDLPSVETIEQPEWAQKPLAQQDSIYLVVSVPYTKDSDMTLAIQNAQSELNLLLQSELEGLVPEFLNGLNPPYPEEQIFKKISNLPAVLEKIMILMEVKDAWEGSGEIAVLCAFDHVEVSAVIMKEMKISDKSFRQFFQWKMNELRKERL